MRRRGMVLEVNGAQVTVITEQGEFLTIRRRGVAVGETIHIAPARTVWPVAAAACLLLLVMMVWPLVGADQPVVLAYVTVDINPSFELVVDERELVTEIRQLSEDGDLIPGGLTGRSVDEAVCGLVRAVTADRWDIDDDLLVVIAVVLEDGGSDQAAYDGDADRSARWQRLIETAAQGAEQGTAGISAARVLAVACGSDVRDRAGSVGLSAGRFMVLEQAREDGLVIDANEIKGTGLTTAVAAAGGNVDQLLARVQDRVQEQRGRPFGIVVPPSGAPGLSRKGSEDDDEEPGQDEAQDRIPAARPPIPIQPPGQSQGVPGAGTGADSDDDDQVRRPVQPPGHDEVPGRGQGLIDQFRRIGDWLLRRGNDDESSRPGSVPGRSER